MKIVQAKLVILACLFIASCGDEEAPPKTAAFPPSHKILSYHINGVGREYTSPDVPGTDEVVGQIHSELDQRLSGQSIPELRIDLDAETGLKLRMHVLHLDGKGGVHYQQHDLVKAGKKGDKYEVRYFNGPFSTPTLVGTHDSASDAAAAIKEVIRTKFFDGYEAMFGHR